jgi:galactosamine-6-phosphate isomerase
MKIEVLKTYEAMSRRAASLIIATMSRRPGAVLCASAGGTPRGAYRALAAKISRRPDVLQQMRVLQIDEWLGLPQEHPATCRSDLERNLLAPLSLLRSRFVGFVSNTPEPAAECRRISNWLGRYGPIDLCILGLGVNGHVAMVEPAAQLQPDVHIARLAPASRRHPLLHGLKPKPTHGLTLGIGNILCSRRILLLVSGHRKKATLARLLKGRVSTRFPASLLWTHGDVTLLCDSAAAP